MDVLEQIVNAVFHEKSYLELIAVILSIAYLVLAMRENIWCWLCAFVSTAIYAYLFFHVFLLMDSVLHIYYMAMAGYGYWSWSRPDQAKESIDTIPITTWSKITHVFVISGILAASLISGYILDVRTDAAWPYLDSFTTWASVVTTYMVAKKILENWLYWLVIDAVALTLYIERGLYFTALLFAIYLVLAVLGFKVWRQRMRSSVSEDHFNDKTLSGDTF